MIFISVRSYASSANSADAAIVLGAAVKGSEPSPVYAERLNHAAQLYKDGRVSYIITTGGTEGNKKKLSEAWVGKLYLVKAGIPENDIYPEGQSKTTFQNIYYGSEIGDRNGYTSYLIVTDPIHMPRAMMMAKNIDLSAAPSPTKTSKYQSWASKLEFLSSEAGLYMEFVSLSAIITPQSNPKTF